MGIDWGASTTVVIMNEEGEIINALELDSRETEGDEVEIIKKLIEDYNCYRLLLILDMGPDKSRNSNRSLESES